MEPDEVLVKAEDLQRRFCRAEHLRGDYCMPKEAEVEKVFAQYMGALNAMVGYPDRTVLSVSTR